MRSTQPFRLSSLSLSYYLCIYRNDFREEVDKRQICNSQRFLFLFWRGSAKQGTKYIYMYTLFSFLSFFLSFFFFFTVYCSFYHSSNIAVLVYLVLLCMSYIKFLVHLLFLFQFFRNTSLALLVYL